MSFDLPVPSSDTVNSVEDSSTILKSLSHLRVGSRRSQLALIQTNYVISELNKLNSELTFEVHTMTTTGDAILNQPLAKIGSKSLFTGELELALINNEVDFVVHSLKDMPTQLPDGLVIACVTVRESPLDSFIAKRGSMVSCLEDLPQGAVIGTSSVRRIAQLKRAYPHLAFADVRGNLNTRFLKLDQGQLYSGLILAAAGLSRLGWSDRITELLDVKKCAYAIGQGALAVECRANDERVMGLLRRLMHRDTFLCCLAERAFLRRLEGGCSVPVAVESLIIRDDDENETLRLRGLVLSNDGSTCLEATKDVSLTQSASSDGENCGEPVAKRLRLSGDADVKLDEDKNEASSERKPAHRIGMMLHNCSSEEEQEQEFAADLGTDLANSLLERGALSILATARSETEAGVVMLKTCLNKSQQEIKKDTASHHSC